MSNRHIRNEVVLLIVLFQQYLFRNETQSVINLLNDSTSLIVMVFGFLYLNMKISETVCYRSSDATTTWQWSRKQSDILEQGGNGGFPRFGLPGSTMKILEVHIPPFPPLFQTYIRSQIFRLGNSSKPYMIKSSDVRKIISCLLSFSSDRAILLLRIIRHRHEWDEIHACWTSHILKNHIYQPFNLFSDEK
jgi:hypothetical protein